MQQVELDPLGRARQEWLDRLVESRELGVAVDRISRVLIVEDPDATDDPLGLITEDEDGFEGGLVAQEVTGEG
ncbi:MAG: hypothetical protein ACKOB2_07775 [Solirubrobacterales bacterium]